MTQEEFIKDCDRAIALIRKMREEISGEKKANYIDLGLPSGTLWAEANEEGFYTFDEAVEKFGKSLPRITQFAELMEFCNWEWDYEKKGCKVTGKNGNSIFLPAEGLRNGEFFSFADICGFCWSGTAGDSAHAYYLEFSNYCVEPANCHKRYYGRSVRLVKSTK